MAESQLAEDHGTVYLDVGVNSNSDTDEDSLNKCVEITDSGLEVIDSLWLSMMFSCYISCFRDQFIITLFIHKALYQLSRNQFSVCSNRERQLWISIRSGIERNDTEKGGWLFLGARNDISSSSRSLIFVKFRETSDQQGVHKLPFRLRITVTLLPDLTLSYRVSSFPKVSIGESANSPYSTPITTEAFHFYRPCERRIDVMAFEMRHAEIETGVQTRLLSRRVNRRNTSKNRRVSWNSFIQENPRRNGGSFRLKKISVLLDNNLLERFPEFITEVAWSCRRNRRSFSTSRGVC